MWWIFTISISVFILNRQRPLRLLNKYETFTTLTNHNITVLNSFTCQGFFRLCINNVIFTGLFVSRENVNHINKHSIHIFKRTNISPYFRSGTNTWMRYEPKQKRVYGRNTCFCCIQYNSKHVLVGKERHVVRQRTCEYSYIENRLYQRLRL